MKLITEQSFDTQTEMIESEGKKNLYITGVFMQGNKKNKNGRIYPTSVLENQMNVFNENLVKKNRALGELDHPSGPTINTDRVSHMITEIRKDGNDFYGKALIIDTPMGNIARKILEAGASLGVSTRGLGTIKQSSNAMVVQEDFTLNTIDIVANPSAHDAWVNGIMENVEWIYNPQNGNVEKVCNELKEQYKKKSPSEEEILEGFNRYIASLTLKNDIK